MRQYRLSARTFLKPVYGFMEDAIADKSEPTPKCLQPTKIVWQLGIIMLNNTTIPLLPRLYISENSSYHFVGLTGLSIREIFIDSSLGDCICQGIASGGETV